MHPVARLLAPLALLLGLFAFPLPSTYASSPILFYEGFDHPASTPLNGQGGWSGSTNITVRPGSLTYGDLITTGNAAAASAGGTIDIPTGLSTPTSGVRWVSAILYQGVPDWREQALILMSGNNEMIRVGNPGQNSPASLTMGSAGSFRFFASPSMATTFSFDTGVPRNSTPSVHFFVLKYDYTNTSITFYYNPTPGAPESSLTPLGTFTTNSHGLAQIHLGLTGIRLRGNNLNADTAVAWDEIRIGNSYADVAPLRPPQILFYEGFNYTASTPLTGRGGWSSTNTNITVRPGSLTYGDLITTGNSAGATSGGNIDIPTGLTTPTTGVRWVSALLYQGVPDWREQALILMSGNNEMIRVGNPGQNSPASLTMGSAGSFRFFNSATSFSLNTGVPNNSTPSVHFFVLKYDYTNTSITFYYNPTPGAPESSLTPLGTVNATSNRLHREHLGLTGIRLRANNLNADTAVAWDEIRIGNSYADVAPIAAQTTLAPYPNATFGFRNLTRSEPPGTLLSHPLENGSEPIGRTTILNYLNGWVIVGAEIPGTQRADSDFVLRVYDISNPANPVRRRPSDFDLTYPGDRWFQGTLGWNAHGFAQVGTLMLPNVLSVPVFGGPVELGGTTSVITNTPIPAGNQTGAGYNRSSQAGPWEASFPWYGAGNDDFTLQRVTNAIGSSNQFQTLATFNHVSPYGGSDWHPLLFGDLLIYVRSGGATRDGIVVYRLDYRSANESDPASPLASVTPRVIASLEGGFQAYWPTLFSDGSGLYVVGSDSEILMAADITEAAAPPSPVISDNPVRLVRSLAMPGQRNATYPVFQDNFAFIHNRKIDMSRFVGGHPSPVALELNEAAPPRPPGVTPGTVGVETSQISLVLGNLWLTGGFHTSTRAQGMGVWVHQEAPDTTRPRVTYHIPQAGRTGYPRFAPLSFLLPEHPRHGGPRNGTDFTVRPVIPATSGTAETLGTFVPGYLIHDFSGVLTFTPSAPLAPNTTYQVNFLANDRGTADPTDDIGFVDAAGNLIEPYSFRFSTGSAVNATPPPSVSSFTAVNAQPSPGQAFTVNALATGSGPLQSLEYRFNFNGTWTAWSGSPTATHTYPDSGRYRVLVQVRDTNGNLTNSTLRILVTNPPPAANSAPTQSSTLAIGTDPAVGTTPATRRLWVVNPDSDTISVLNATTGAKEAEYSTGPGSNPRSIARDNQGRYWVTCQGTDQILVFNPNGTIAHTLGRTHGLPYGSAPFGIAPSPDGQSLFVTLYGSGRLLRYSAASPTAAPTAINTPFPTPRALAVANHATGGQRILVTRFISAEQQGQVGDFTFTPSTNTLASVRVIPLDYAYTTDGGDRAAGVPNHLAAIAISPDGTRAAVASKQDNIRRGVFYGVDDLTHETTVRAVVSFLDLSANAELRHTRRDLDNSADPSALTYSPRGDTLFIALQGNNQLVGLDTLSLPPVPTTDTSIANATLTSPGDRTFELATGHAPQGVLIDPETKRLFTQNFIGRSITLRDATPFLTQNQTSFPQLAGGHVSTVTNELLSPQILLGKKIFYDASDRRMSADGYLSCVTCHADGGHDGRVWDFTGRGEGFRRTADLRGRSGTAHGNLHWSGNFDEIQDFEHDIRGPFGGTGFLPLEPTAFAKLHPSPASTKAGLSPELDALAAYVASLTPATTPRSPHRESTGTLTPQAILGRAVFTAQSCTDCHSGSALTDSTVTRLTTPTLHDVGTLTAFSGLRLGDLVNGLQGIDTPTLHGLHASRVHLHHGEASTLDDVFNYAGGALYFASAAEPLNLASDALQTDDPLQGGGGGIRGALGGSLVRLSGDNTASLRFTRIDGGLNTNPATPPATRPARLAIRYISLLNDGGEIDLLVNGEPAVSLPIRIQEPDTNFQISGWRWLVATVNLRTGDDNTITLRRKNRDVRINAILVANADDIAAAHPHNRVRSLSTSDQSNLLAYLRSLDYRDASGAVLPTPPAPAPLLPAVLTQPQPALLAATNPLSLYVVATGTGPFTYQWTRSGTPVGGNSPVFELPSVQLSDAGNYRVRITNSAGSVDSSMATVTVNPYLAITTAVLPTATVGRPYTLDLAANGGTSTRTWTLAPGQHLPPGLTLTPDGRLTGTPTAPLRETITFRVADSSGFITRAIPIEIRPVGGFTTDADLLLHYTFDEGSGTRVWDSSPAGNDHSTTVPGATWTPDGRFGGAYGVAGSLASAVTPFIPANQSDLDFDPRGQDFTVSVWFRTNSTKTYHTLLSKNTAPDSNRYYQYMLGVTDPASSINALSGSSWSSSFVTTPAVNNGDWHLAVLVNYLDGSTWRRRLYFNGGTSFQQVDTGTLGKVADSLIIGRGLNVWDSQWRGHIDDLRIYRRALAPAEITALYAPTLPPSYDSWIVGLANPPSPAHRAPSATAPGAYVSNLLAYAFNLDLWSPASPAAVPSPVLSGNRLQITFTRLRSDLNYIVEVSSNLTTWTTLAHNPGTLGSPTTVQDTVTLGSGHSSRYLRLRIEER